MRQRIALNHGIVEVLEEQRAGVRTAGVGRHRVGVAGQGGQLLVQHVAAVVGGHKAAALEKHGVALDRDGGGGGERQREDRAKAGGLGDPRGEGAQAAGDDGQAQDQSDEEDRQGDGPAKFPPDTEVALEDQGFVQPQIKVGIVRAGIGVDQKLKPVPERPHDVGRGLEILRSEDPHDATPPVHDLGMREREMPNPVDGIEPQGLDPPHRHHEAVDHRVRLHPDRLARGVVLGETLAQVPEQLGAAHGVAGERDVEEVVLPPLDTGGHDRQCGGQGQQCGQQDCPRVEPVSPHA